MRPDKYTVLLIPDNESAGKSFTFKRRWFILIIAITVAIIKAVLIGLVSLIPYYLNIYGNYYLILLVIGVEIPLAIVVVLFMKSPSISTAKQSEKLLKFSTIIGLTAILVDHYAS